MDTQFSPIRMFKQIKESTEKYGNNNLKSTGLTLSQGSILLYMSEREQTSMKELERVFHVSQPTIVGIVSRLEKNKLVESFGLADDKRIKIVRLTQSGKNLIANIRFSMNTTQNKLFSGLTKDERKIFMTLLTKISNSLE